MKEFDVTSVNDKMRADLNESMLTLNKAVNEELQKILKEAENLKNVLKHH